MPAPTPPTIRIGCVQYLNTLPLIEGLSAWKDAELVMAVPSQLIDMLVPPAGMTGGDGAGNAGGRAEGEGGGGIDLGLISLIDAALSEHELALLPVGMIGSDGFTQTVRLCSRVPIEDVRALHADTDSHTSVALAQIVLHKRCNLRPQIVPFDARRRSLVHAGPGADAATEHGDTRAGDWPQTVLLIGDKVVTDPPPESEYPHQLDLGQAWRDLTGLPFVYAAWMCRAEDADSPRIRAAAQVLDRARRHNKMRLDWIVDARADQRRWPRDQARKYIGTSLSYDVGERQRQAAQRFIDEAAELGLCPKKTLTWLDDVC